MKYGWIQMNRMVWVAAALLGLAACSVGPNYKPPRVDAPDQFSEIGSATQPTSAPSTQVSVKPDYQSWWETLSDQELNTLIARAVRQNPDVRAAADRIRAARGQRGVTASQLFPQINATGSYTHTRDSENLPGISELSGSSGGFQESGLEADLWQAGFDATWEIDVFGGTRRAVESASDTVQAAIWDRRDVLVSLLAEVAVNYIELRGAQRELQIAEGNLQSQQQTLDLTRRRAEGGLIPYLDVAQQEAQVATTAATIPVFESEIRLAIHHLSVLLGESPGALSDELTPVAPIPVGPASIPPGVPAELLRRRPDVRRAERQLASQTAQIGVAVADFFPQFSVTGAMGTASQPLKRLFDYTSRMYEVAPGVTWDIFDAGKVYSNVKVQTALQAEALETYRKAVLQSFQDVDDSLVTFNREQVRLEALKAAVVANQRAVDLSTELFEKGSTDFLSVLDAQRSLFAAEDAMAQSEQQVTTDLVSLYKALGGGWQPGTGS